MQRRFETYVDESRRGQAKVKTKLASGRSDASAAREAISRRSIFELLPNIATYERRGAVTTLRTSSSELDRSHLPFFTIMILRSFLLIVGSYILGNGALSARAGTPFDCHITLGSNKFDLTTIAGEQVVNKTRNTEPTLMVDSLKFNLCSDLTIQSDIPESDQVRVLLELGP